MILVVITSNRIIFTLLLKIDILKRLIFQKTNKKTKYETLIDNYN